MTSVVSIVNGALGELEGSQIVSLTDGSRNANIANGRYETVRDALLRSHTWNFAATRVKLARNATAPVSGYNYAYQLPSDFLRLTHAWDNNNDQGRVEYRLEGDKTLLTDAEEVYIKYVRRVSDPNAMTADFVRLLEFELAAAMALAVTNSNSMKEAMRDEADKWGRIAKSADAIEDYPERLPYDSWVTERDR